jgi:hypothetical protein
MNTPPLAENVAATSASSSVPILRRVCTWEEWEAGREARRKLARQISGGKVLRRRSGKPAKDELLRRLNNGQRGLPFQSVKNG